MKLYTEGDKGQAICGTCGLSATTFAYRDVPFSDNSGTVKDILVAVCDGCGAIVAIPPQSTPAIKAEREKATVSVEAILPAIYLDALDLACYRIDSHARRDFRKKLLVYYLHAYAANAEMTAHIATMMERAPAEFITFKSNITKRLSFKVTGAISKEIDNIMTSTKLNKTDLIKSVVIQINDDIILGKSPKTIRQIQSWSAVVAG